MKPYQNPDEILEALARKRVKKLKDYYFHLSLFGVILVVYISKTFFGVELDFFPFELIDFKFTAIWAAVFIMYSISVFTTNTFFGRKWEQNKIQKILDSNKERKHN